MKKTRLIAFALVLVMLLSMLCACSDEQDGNQDGGDRTGDGWDGVDFGGREVVVALSTNKYDECNFPAASIYTRGPDSQSSSNPVAQAVVARNAKAERDINVKIKYMEKNLTYDKLLQDIQDIVLTASTNSPDIYNNDMFGLSRAMMDGLLWNVKNPGENVKSYFDFSKKGWNETFMKGCTFDQNKYYMFAGDYFIDMLRMAWVLFVNNDLLKANLGRVGFESTDEFYEYVEAGIWDYTMLADMCDDVFRDTKDQGKTSPDDALVGLAYNHVTAWVFGASTGITTYYQDENRNPKVIDSISTLYQVAQKYTNLTSTQGVYYEEQVLTSTNYFLKGNFLFAASRLGELESDAVRKSTIDKGIVPVPKWNEQEQEDYHTMVHDQTEIGAILVTAKSFSAASALMQALNEDSQQVIYKYYDEGLKYKYNLGDGQSYARKMMDIVKNSIDSPFGFQISAVIGLQYTGTEPLNGLSISSPEDMSGNFASEKGSYDNNLRLTLEKFSKLN